MEQSFTFEFTDHFLIVKNAKRFDNGRHIETVDFTIKILDIEFVSFSHTHSVITLLVNFSTFSMISLICDYETYTAFINEYTYVKYLSTI
jgi:hypothetical protein